MSPPPQTPTPRRFVFPRRPPPSSARFASTPRFNPPSSTNRPPGTQLRNASIEDVEEEEEEERISMSSVEGATQDDEDEGSEWVGRRRDVVGDAIEVFSQSQSQSLGADVSYEDDMHGSTGLGDVRDEEMETDGETSSSQDERDIKRRKMSITPLPAFSSPIPNRNVEAYTKGPNTSSPETDEGGEDGDETQLPSSPSRPQSHAQPTFHAAPRFKPLDEASPEGLPVAFSPQRRGQKYLHGGLAAQLQGWLSEVKKGSDTGSQDGEGGGMKVQVEEVRAGRRMYLVKGKRDERVVLAGEGRLTGLGRRAVVEVGCWVVLGRPVWDVEFEGERWVVACDWNIE